MNDIFVSTGNLKKEYVQWYQELLALHKDIVHHEINDLKGAIIDGWQERTEKFVIEMTRLVQEVLKL